MSTFKLQLIEADGRLYEGECQSVIVPTTDGLYGIMANHCPVIASIIPGEVKFTVPTKDGGSEVRYAAVSYGLLKVENGDVMILVDSAEKPEEIDENAARRAADAAKEALLQKRSRQEYQMVEAKLARAINRLRTRAHHIEG